MTSGTIRNGTVQKLTVHHRDWLNKQPIGQTARLLWNRGYTFDYVSDRQLQDNIARSNRTGIFTCGGDYRTLVVPPCTHMPLDTLEAIA